MKLRETWGRGGEIFLGHPARNAPQATLAKYYNICLEGVRDEAVFAAAFTRQLHEDAHRLPAEFVTRTVKRLASIERFDLESLLMLIECVLDQFDREDSDKHALSEVLDSLGTSILRRGSTKQKLRMWVKLASQSLSLAGNLFPIDVMQDAAAFLITVDLDELAAEEPVLVIEALRIARDLEMHGWIEMYAHSLLSALPDGALYRLRPMDVDYLLATAPIDEEIAAKLQAVRDVWHRT